ncbi:MAG: FHA domain-containing protein, partial [Myxococcota bacterium]
MVVEYAGQELMRVPIRGAVLTVGRDPSTDIHLDHRSLSRRHAQIERRGAALWVRDLGSHNGTFVNGKRVDEAQALVDGDVIEVGRYRLSLDGVEIAAGDTPVLTLTGPEGTHRFAMVGEEIVLGRATSCDIAISHQSISRRHLRLWREHHGFFVEDLGSQNGTKLRGKRIQGPTRIEVGEQLQLSEFTLELGLLQQSVPP